MLPNPDIPHMDADRGAGGDFFWGCGDGGVVEGVGAGEKSI